MTKGVQDLMVGVERVRDAFHQALYGSGDAAEALALADENCSLRNVPTGTGGNGQQGLRCYLEQELLPHRPADLTFRRISRTGNRWSVAQEDAVSFTHDRELPWLLPGVPPTGHRVQILAMSVVEVRRSRVTSHRTLWDHATLLTQLDLRLEDVPIKASEGAVTTDRV